MTNCAADYCIYRIEMRRREDSAAMLASRIETMHIQCSFVAFYIAEAGLDWWHRRILTLRRVWC